MQIKPELNVYESTQCSPSLILLSVKRYWFLSLIFEFILFFSIENLMVHILFSFLYGVENLS